MPPIESTATSSTGPLWEGLYLSETDSALASSGSGILEGMARSSEASAAGYTMAMQNTASIQAAAIAQQSQTLTAFGSTAPQSVVTGSQPDESGTALMAIGSIMGAVGAASHTPSGLWGYSAAQLANSAAERALALDAEHRSTTAAPSSSGTSEGTSTETPTPVAEATTEAPAPEPATTTETAATETTASEETVEHGSQT